MGSLIAAVASYLDALSNDGEWLVRIEDIDPQREIAGSSKLILQALDAHGFEYDSPLYQHTRLDTYNKIIDALLAAGDAYYCSCTRQAIEATAIRGRTGLVYPGTCRNGATDQISRNSAVRVRTSDNQLSFNDGLQGHQTCRLATEIGDFTVRRGDGLVAYQLAVVADDSCQRITHIVRGIDLLDATFMQIHLQKLLGYQVPCYRHIPVLIDTNGSKLSKQTGAQALDCSNPVKNIFQALVLLGQTPEKSLLSAPLEDIWAWGLEHWNPGVLAGRQQIQPDESMIFSVNRTLGQ
jgi:glutamyl-Q tRNA(Asp) synthetase